MPAIAGGVSAALFAVALMHVGTMAIMLAYIAGIPLFLAGLSAGNAAGVIASATGILGTYLSGSTSFATTYAVFTAVPATLLIILALRHRVGSDQKTYWYPEGFLMTALSIYPCLIFIVASVVTADQGGLLTLTTDALNQTLDSFKDKTDAATIVQLTAMIDYMARLLPSFAGCAWMVVTMVSMICAQNALAKKVWNIRPSFHLQALHIPAWMIFAMAATGLGAQFAPQPYEYICVNLSIMLGVPFFFVGLAIVHAWAATHKKPQLILIIFYVVASLIIWSTILVVALGVFDQWFNFRRRFAVRPKANMN